MWWKGGGYDVFLLGERKIVEAEQDNARGFGCH